VLDREGVIWLVQPSEILKRETDESTFEPFKAGDLRRRLLEQLPPGFQTYVTTHYLFCYNTSSAYAEWCGKLYERLYKAFHTFWKNRGLPLHDPDMPLISIVFDRQENYVNFARGELGEATANIIAYYSLQTNRVTMYDLTGTGGLQGAGGRLTNSAQINQLLMQPGAERMVATIIHEATHQLAFNCGLHTRFADIPLWVSEGLAVYFETPDLRSAEGWRNIGGVNRLRLDQLRGYLRKRDRDSLATLFSDDKRFRQPTTALDTYAEAWAMSYYLLRQRSKEYVAYLQQLAEKKPMLYDTPQERLTTIQQAFGGDLQALDTSFLRFLATVR
jgi:hypothetical protein